MIFVTVGAQLPFDRLVRVVDDWAEREQRDDVFAQIAKGERPRSIAWTDFLDATEFRQKVSEAEVVIAHAGMGSIITALEFGKPILVLARRGSLGETRNDHQVATARRLAEQGMVTVAHDEVELAGLLAQIDRLESPRPIADEAPEPIVQAIRSFLDDLDG